MNRIYKVIYSKARQCAMVVSELAKSSHKNSRKGADHVGTPALARMVAAVLVAGTLTWGSVPEVSWAAETAENKAGAGIGIAIGDNSKTDKFAKNQIAIGVGAKDVSDGSAPNSSGYNGTGGLNSAYYVAQNLGSTILGTLNSNESASAKDNALRLGWSSTTITPSSSGIANSIVGVANTVKNPNGSIVLGAGNTVSNSSTKIVDDITGSYSELKNWQPTSYKSVNDMAQDLRDKVKSSKSGGATLVIGGGNEATNTLKTQIIGVNNTVTGTEDKPSDYNMVNAFGTDVTNSSHLYTIGDDNHITDTTKTIVFGDNRYVSNTHDSIIIGSLDKSDKPQYTTATDATIIGHNANAWGNRSMALGKDVYTTGDDSVAIGSAVAAYSKNSIAIGSSDGFY